MQQITYITGNPAKAGQLSRHLDYPVSHQTLDVTEIQSLDLEAVVREKVVEAHRQVGGTVLVEDTSLVFTALGNLPGPLIKWFLEELQPAGLCKLLDGYSDRGAVARCLYALYDGTDIHFFDGSVSGTIATEPRGEHGFGWDPIFIPAGETQTRGEILPANEAATSARYTAIIKLAAYLHSLD